MSEITKKPELLAPAGTLEVFETAVAGGADAVYIGAPFFNARELARHFTMAEVAAMIDHGHRHNVKIFLAMNSLVKESELPRAVESLARLEELAPDGLIIQDLGLYSLLKQHFPKLRVHASTLLAAHNVPAVKRLTSLGFSRVVLPRELTIREIGAIRAETKVELEVFVHGAMCFSYSGLCLFSSYQGGKSGLRGRCVQPCRRRYTWQAAGRKEGGSGYFFSMNDLQGLELLDELRRAGVDSLKIEGRMRNAAYVGNVVKGYRLALDHPDDPQARGEALRILGQAMGRKPTRGYFPGVLPKDALTPHHSGNVGKFLGKTRTVRGQVVAVQLKEEVKRGDRLRLHQEDSGDRQAFSLKELRIGKRLVESARVGEIVLIECPGQPQVGDSLFKVDLAGRRTVGAGAIHPEKFAGKLAGGKPLAAKVRPIVTAIATLTPSRPSPGKSGRERGGAAGRRQSQLPLWVKSEDPQLLRQRFPAPVERLLLVLTPPVMAWFAKLRVPEATARRLVWALPPLIDQEAVAEYRRMIGGLVGKGFKDWQIAHLGQLEFFTGLDCRLSGDYRLNILNSLAGRFWQGQGLSAGQVSIETDQPNLVEVLAHQGLAATGMTIYGFPPLFTSRYAGVPLQYGRELVSPRGEGFVLRQAWGYTLALADRPFSLLHRLGELAVAGLDYGVIDLSGVKLSDSSVAEVFRLLSDRKGVRVGNEFNFSHQLG
ncbi:MAG: U32 family peptidase [Desulfobulbaceae bacterium]|nr:U32 family peptidase [Desulfobulbaceae bacterium]